MSVENVLWGAPRIQGELLKLGFTVAQSTVAKYMAKRDISSSCCSAIRAVGWRGRIDPVGIVTRGKKPRKMSVKRSVQPFYKSPRNFAMSSIKGIIQALRKSIHLVAMAPGGKGQDLTTELVQPTFLFWQAYCACLDARRLRVHAHRLVSLGINRNRVNVVVLPEVLDERHARPLVFDEQ
jgi:hypothetical protein